MKSLAWKLVVAVLAVFAAPAATFAHPMPNSLLLLDVFHDRVEAQIHIPITDFGLATGFDFGADPSAFVAGHEPEIADYLLTHTAALAEDGTAWTVFVGDISVEQARTDAGLYAELGAELVLTPPPGITTTAFVLDYDAVIHQVVTHAILVSVRQDWMNGQVEPGESTQIGVIQVNPVDGTIAPLSLDLSAGSYLTGFVHMMQLGMTHIAAGTDHLLFLLVLLLPAPLLATSGAWRGYAGSQASLWKIVRIVTAFTIGHSATLVLAGLLRLELPQQPIEVLIALTIMIGAVHALRPLFAGREAYIAGAFGLIHGMAFSFTLAELDLSTPQLILSLLGFNLGIELVQLAIVLAAMPALLMLARSGFYTPVRVAGGLTALLAAIGWVAARLGMDNPLAEMADALGAYAPHIIAALTAGAVLALLASRYAPAPPKP